MRCSNPACKRATIGPEDEGAGTVNLGAAAHITGASAAGPRYDSSLTPEERRSAANGIWLCQMCAKLVDDDDDRFSAELLHEWKRNAEQSARTEVTGAVSSELPKEPLRFGPIDRAFDQIAEEYRAAGFETHVGLLSSKDGKLLAGWQVATHKDTGRPVHRVFEAGPTYEESVLFVRKSRK